MILIFGGSYNGKLHYCKTKYNFNDNEIFFCSDENLNYNKKVICGLHVFVRKCTEKHINPLQYIKDNINNLKDKIIICDETGSGIVPLRKEDRYFREECGRVMQYLSIEAEEVYRIFFGIEEKLK